MTSTLTASPIDPELTDTDQFDLADHIRSSSTEQHRSTETRPFISDLMRGKLSLADYTRYLAQYGWIYEALEELVARSQPCELFDPALARMPSIESDLKALGAANWRDDYPPLAATTAYVKHLRALPGDNVIGCLAHHYTRYLGDLSGGQAISRLVERHYDANAEQLAFYRFDAIEDIVHYKRNYRAGMNALTLTQDEIDALVTEVDLAFGFNGAIFDELAA